MKVTVKEAAPAPPKTITLELTEQEATLLGHAFCAINTREGDFNTGHNTIKYTEMLGFLQEIRNKLDVEFPDYIYG